MSERQDNRERVKPQAFKTQKANDPGSPNHSQNKSKSESNSEGGIMLSIICCDSANHSQCREVKEKPSWNDLNWEGVNLPLHADSR
jgi:hypothetical protein